MGLNVFSLDASKTKNVYIMYYYLLFTRFVAILMFEMFSEDSIFLPIFVTFNKCSSTINFSNDEENGIIHFSYVYATQKIKVRILLLRLYLLMFEVV